MKDLMTATYSPEDNKLRLYSVNRLDPELYKRVRNMGFIWAPKQQLFVAPMWTPARAELLIKLCGEIDDESTSVEERAVMRAKRFEKYQTNRAKDAENALKTVESISGNIPLGQPILIGHHSEKRARKDAERIENAMQKAVTMWDRSEYWENRAKSVILHASYKDKPGVRMRRIKKLEAEKRKLEKEIKQATGFTDLWSNKGWKDPRPFDMAKALFVANRDHIHAKFTLEKYPRASEISQYEGSQSLWSALDAKIIDERQAATIAIECHTRSNVHREKWLEHTKMRINYENTLLNAQGCHMPTKEEIRAQRPKLAPIVNFPGEGFASISKEEWAKINNDYKGCKVSKCGTYRYRTCMLTYTDQKDKGYSYGPVWIKDAKIVEPPKKEVSHAG